MKLDLEEEEIAKAEALFNKKSVVGKMQINSSKVEPVNNVALKKKERKVELDKTAGKSWGYMPKMELTEEVKQDLKAIKLRNFMFRKRFYKGNESEKFPQYFQIGTVVEGAGSLRTDRVSKK